MTGITIGPDGVPEQAGKKWSYSQELCQLHSEWHKATGCDMPPHVACMPLDGIRNALRYVKDKFQPVTETGGNDSLEYWDAHKQH